MKLTYLPFAFATAIAILLVAAPNVSRSGHAFGQAGDYDPSWYQPGQRYLKIAVVEDGVYALDGAHLEAAGAPLSAIDPATLRLFEKGQEIPLWSTGDDAASLQAGHRLYFVGQRNRGTEETWAYQNNPSLQSSTFRSLYTDTTFYWLTWGGPPGLRYDVAPPPPHQAGFINLGAVRDTLHLETDATYYFGDSFDAGHPLYTRGEGFYWARFSNNGTNPVTQNFDLTLEEALPGSEPLHVRIRLNSESASRHRVTLEARILENGALTFQQVAEADWTGYAFQDLTFSLSQNQIPANGVLRLQLTSHNEFNGNPNRVLLDWIGASYVRRLTAALDQFSFDLAEAGSYNLTADGFAGTTAYLFAPTLRRILEAPVVNGQIALAEIVQQPATFWAVQQDQFLAPLAVTADEASDLAAPTNAADYLILTAPTLHASAQAMAAYREASGYSVQIVDVRDVFDQFDYGRPTPLAIRRFLQQTRQWSTPPRFLLIWGDAPFPVDTDRSVPAWAVPSFGYASSDGWFAMQANGPADFSEFLAIGRVTGRTDAEGLLFLQKLQAYEAAPLEPWQKRMLLLAGGSNPSEQLVLQSHTLRWGNIAAVSPTGMDTLRFFKQAFTALDTGFQDSLRAAFREGAGWLNYFGHSAVHTWEIVTDTPDEFDNAGRLPVVISLGCRTGTFAGGASEDFNLPSYGEQMLLSSLNGAIAHWGASDSGVISASARLNDTLIDLVFADTVRVLGLATQLAKKGVADVYTDALSRKHILMFNLLGDPATRLLLPTRPDLYVTDADIAFSPVAPVPADSQMTVTLRVNNQGLIPADSVTVQLLHVLPGGERVLYVQQIPPPALQHEVSFTIPLSESMVGENTFVVEVDPDDTIPEEEERNNAVTLTQIVFTTGLTIISPPDLGLVTSTQPRLRLSLASAQDLAGSLIVQLDTLASFDSPARIEHTITASQIAASWQPPQPLEDGRTYFWRTRVDDPSQPPNWQQAAFTVRTDVQKAGWLQQQTLFDLNTQNAFLLRQNDRWAFNEYKVEVKPSSERGSGALKGVINVNGREFLWLTLGWGIVVIDGQTGVVRDFAAMPTYAMPQSLIDAVGIDSAQAVARLDEITSTLRPGDYVFARTRHLGNRSGPVIQDEVKALLRRLGSTAIDTLTYQHLWLFFTRVGHPETTREWAVGPGNPEINEIAEEFTLLFSHPEGQTISPRIGPAREWHTLDWAAALENTASEIQVEILSADGASTLLAPQTNGPVDLTALDAQAHPYIRLRATLSDSSQAGTPQLQSWHVTYDPIAELALDPSRLVLAGDTLDEGASLPVSTTVANLSDVDADEVLIDYFITDAQNRTLHAGTDTLATLPADSAHTFSRTFSTEGLRGASRFKVTLTQPGLREPITYNNALLRDFYVTADRTPPRVQVFVEGKQYPNDPAPLTNVQDPTFPFVSTRPRIEIDIEDDSAHLLLADTTGLDLRLDGQRVPFSHPDLRFEPATLQRNRARLVFTPDLAGRDTTHTLYLETADASGNEAAPYQLHFRVQSSIEVESLYPYPNPMTSFTQFAFQLRGADPGLVEELRLRIFSINGRLIREFDLLRDPGSLEGGALRIGWNKLPWDTRDADGDLVGSGVYLYKVYLRAEGLLQRVNNEASVEKLVVIR